ncbi:hypothetical protein SZ54_4671 [Rhizobium sp. UR51a]|nr:hypothetical protein SZ54_4671 [Rhizobium sp. UR51a]
MFYDNARTLYAVPQPRLIAMTLVLPQRTTKALTADADGRF